MAGLLLTTVHTEPIEPHLRHRPGLAFLAMPLGFWEAYVGIGQRVFLALYPSRLILVATALRRAQGPA